MYLSIFISAKSTSAYKVSETRFAYLCQNKNAPGNELLFTAGSAFV